MCLQKTLWFEIDGYEVAWSVCLLDVYVVSWSASWE